MRLRLLGTAAVEGLDGSGAGPTGQALALLAVLACAGPRGMSRDKLLALFWPDSPPDRSAHRLSQLAHSLRRRPGCGELIAGVSELRLDPERISCDLWELDAARKAGELGRAAALYAGPLLDGFFLPENPEAERWLDARRAALAREHEEVLESLAVEAEVRGDPRAAALWWRRLADHEPFSSRVTLHLMTALAASGDRARALEQALAYQAQVREALDAEPNPAVLALATQLRTPSPARETLLGVLPIEALDEGPEARAYAQGLTEELSSSAARLPGVRVASRTSLLAVRQETRDVRELGARLGLGVVLEGSVRRDGERVRLMVRLVDVNDGCQRWGGRFDREVRAGFEGQEALAREVMEAIAPVLRPAAASPRS